jgi:hypothetical protein
MMKSFLLVALGSLLLISLPHHTGVAHAAAAQEKPQLTVIGPPRPVASLKHLWDRTPVVVLATAREPLEAQLAPDGLVFRFQPFDIEEIFKDSQRSVLGETRVLVRQYGGTVRVEGRDFITPYTDTAVGALEQAVLFLAPFTGQHPLQAVGSPAPVARMFMVPGGSYGILPITGKARDLVSISATASKLPEFAGRRQVRKDELLATLRQFKAGR